MRQAEILTQTPSALARGYLICTTGTVIWSLTGVLIRHLTLNYQLPAMVLAAWRDIFVSLTMLLALAVVSRSLLRVRRNDLGFLILYGTILAVFNTLWTVSVTLNGASVSTVLIYSSAAYTALLGRWLFGERLDAFKILVILLSISGCVLVAGAYQPHVWQVNLPGILTGFASALGFTVYSLMGKTSAQRGINSWTALLYTFGVAAVLLVGANFALSTLDTPLASTNLFWLGSSLDGWGVLVLLAVGPTIGGYGLYTLSLDYLPASIANLIATMEPVFTAVLAYLLLGELLTPLQWLGGLMILGGVVLLRLRDSRMQPGNGPLLPG